MTHYIACPNERCEGEIALVLARDGTPELDNGPFMTCSAGCQMDNSQEDAVWNEADSKAHDWDVCDAEAIVEASARAYMERDQ